MRLLYITNGITGVGGLERVLSIKTAYMIEHYDYEISFVTLNELEKKPFYDFHHKIKFYSIEIKGNSFSYIRSYISGIKKQIKIVNPDKIIVCDDGLKAFFLPLIFQNQKIIYERHVSNNIIFKNSSSFFKNSFAKFQLILMNHLSKLFESFIVLNEGNRKEWKYQNNIKVIGNPISFAPKQTASLTNFKAIAVGKQSYQKNYERMINLWAKVIQDFPNWQLHIYGKEDEKLKLTLLIDELKMSDHIFLHAPVSNIEEKYLESSLFLMTSRFEGMPMVMLEAMACGLPLISFDSPHGPKELIKNGINGFLIDYDDDDDWIIKVKHILSNNEIRKKIGKNSKCLSNEYSLSKIMEEWSNIISK